MIPAPAVQAVSGRAMRGRLVACVSGARNALKNGRQAGLYAADGARRATLDSIPTSP
jgi:hypothetical protein